MATTRKTAAITRIRSASFQPLAEKVESGKTIHELLAELHQELRTLKWSITDASQQIQISAQMEEINRLNFLLFKKAIETNTAAWSEATREITAAKELAEEAQKEIEKTVKTVQQVAQVIKIVSTLLMHFA